MIPFELVEPRSLNEALKCLDRDDPYVGPIAGYTAVMLMMKPGLFRPQRLVSLRGLGERFSRIETAADGSLRIGAMVRLAQLERSAAVERHAPVITRALKRLSNRRVRNVATLGGHLAHGDPHLDLPPVLIALDARLVIAARTGEREMPLAALITGYYETVLRHDEVIAEVIVPPQGGRRSAYLKYTARSADDWPALGLAISLEADGDTVRNSRIILGAATEKPTRLAGAEAALANARLDDRSLKRAGDAAAAEAEIVGDQHGSAAYKQALLRVCLARAATSAIASSSGAAS